jgi:hypothetical protein
VDPAPSSKTSAATDWPGSGRYGELETRILAALRPALSEDEFGALALEIHAFQRTWNEPYARWCAGQPKPRNWREIPAVPQAMFKRYRLACFPPSATRTVFRTSGTTGETRGEHHFLNTRLYEASVLAGWRMFRQPRARPIVLAPRATEAPDSSLASMLQYLATEMERPAVWLCQAGGQLDLSKLETGAPVDCIY